MDAPTNILILGGSGMLGHKLFQHLRTRFPGVRCALSGKSGNGTLGRVELFSGPDVVLGVDVLDTPNFTALLARLKPAVIINCVGIVKQRAEAKDPIQSILINSLLPHQLARQARTW